MLSRSTTSPSSSDLSDAKRSLLQKFLAGETRQRPVSSRTINRRTQTDPPRISFAQERLWFLDQLMPGSPVFNVPIAVSLSTPIDSLVLERSLNEIIRRHEVLRTTFKTVDGEPVPVVQPQLDIRVRVLDLRDLPVAKCEAEARLLTNTEAEQPFDLACGPLLRASLILLSDYRQVLLLTMHHICSDGWSLVVLFRELAAIYDCFSHQRQSPLVELPLQYADYAAWQREWLQGEVLDKQLRYWKEQLGGDLPVLDLPTDRPRPATQSYRGARASLDLSARLTESLFVLSQREGATLFMTLLAAFKTLLFRYAGQDDIIVGSPIANRPQTETEQLIGFFLNNLALRTDLGGNPSFQEVLARVRKTALEAYAHQDVPFERLIEELKPERDLSRTTIFQVYFNLFNFADEIKLPGRGPQRGSGAGVVGSLPQRATDLTEVAQSARGVSFFAAWSQSDENLSKFDLTLYAGVEDSKHKARRIKLALVYNTDLFDERSIKQMLDHLGALLQVVTDNPQIGVADYQLFSGTETRGDNLIGPTNRFISFPREEIEQSIPNRFAAQVKKYGKKTAIKSRNYEWSYADLNALANLVAMAVNSEQAEPGTSSPQPARGSAVALLFPHDAPMIAALLGTLKAGKAYVPLDPSYPQERLAQMLQDSEAGALVTDNNSLSLARKLAGDRLRLINIDNLETIPAAGELNLSLGPHELAYLLYTSGSTGQPKAVMQNHRNVLHFISVYTNNLHLSSDDRLTLLSSYCFDAAVMDIFGALLNGATLYPIDIREEGLAGLRDWLSNERITIYHSTPTVYRSFLNTLEQRNAFPAVRLAVLGGEQVSRADVDLYKKYFADDCWLVNGLGPTEATVSLQYFIDKQTVISGQGVPVGYPVAETEILLLNEAGLALDIRGEIAIKSEHVALGYWRNAEATDAAFSTDAAGPRRIYRTGDMGRRLPDGAIVFAGRKDFQVKIRGFRVELGDIEAALSHHPAVRESVVVLRKNQAGEGSLVSYVVLNQERPATREELRAFIKDELPEYMLPAAFVMMKSLPLTASGKLNRRALPEAVEHGDKAKATAGLPQTTVEKLLAKIWSDLLGVKVPGVNDNFFESGGHSLLAVRLFAQVEKYFSRRLPLATLFQAPTIAQLAEIIQRDWAPRWSSLVPIQPSGSRPPFFCVHALGGNVLEYYDLARHLGPDQPFYGFQSHGVDPARVPHIRIEEMAAHYIKEMREIQPTGPYLLGGRSMGGTIAFEMACQLQAAGEEVGLVALLDSYPSGYLKLLQEAENWAGKVARGAKRAGCHIANLQDLPVTGKVRYAAQKLQFGPARLKAALWRRAYSLYQRLGRPLPRALRDVREFNSLATHNYAPQVFGGQLTLFWASRDRRATFDLVDGWRRLAGGGLKVHEVSGDHLNIIKEPYVGELALKLQSCLEQLQQSPANNIPRIRSVSDKLQLVVGVARSHHAA